MAYNYIKQVEVDGQIIPVGHSDFAFESVNSWNEPVLCFRIHGETSTTGLITLVLKDAENRCTQLHIPYPVNNSKSYYQHSFENMSEEVKLNIYTNNNGSVTLFRLVNSCNIDSCSISINAPNAWIEIVPSDIDPSGNINNKMVQQTSLSKLTSGVDYGTAEQRDALGTGTPGRIFFVKV